MIQAKLTAAKDRARIDRLGSKAYRDAYLEAQVHSWVSHQFRVLRKSLGFTQKEMAEKIGKPQSVISRLENDEYGKVSLQTLLDVAQAVDVALVVQFVSYPEFLERMRDKSPAGMVPESITESTERLNRTFATQVLRQSASEDPRSAPSHFGLNSELGGHVAYPQRNRDKNFNTASSALIQTRNENTQTIMRTLQ